MNNSKLKIVIPVAGEGTRMRPHTYTTPKPLLEVAGRTILDHIIEPLIDLNPNEIIFVIGYMGNAIKEYVKNNYDFKASFVEQADLLGLGFAIYLGIKDIEDSPILVVLGDTIAKADYSKILRVKDNCLGLKEVDDPRRFGVAVVENDRIVALEEKPENPKSNLAVIGLYYFESSFVLRKYLKKIVEKNITTRGEIQITDAMDHMIRDGHIFHPCIVDDWLDCGKKETLLETNRKLLRGQNGRYKFPGTTIIPPVKIASTARIKNSTIGPHVSIADGVEIINSKVKNSIIFKRAVIDCCQLEESLIGSETFTKDASGILNTGSSTEVG
ncbi:MAG: sugar phosphate nucleotidyltransferase [Candidatus Zixiibacteriota bacterium]